MKNAFWWSAVILASAATTPVANGNDRDVVHTIIPAGDSEITWEITGVQQPHALALDDQNKILYSTNYDLHDEQIRRRISVIDVSVPFQEAVTGQIEAPVPPFDLRVAASYLFAIALDRSQLYATNDGIQWIDIPLTPVGGENGIEKVLFPWRDQLLVLHKDRRLLDFVDTSNLQLSRSVDLPAPSLRMAIVGDYLVLMSRALLQPFCGSLGPMVWLYTLPEMELVYNIDIHGDCPQDVAAEDQTIFVSYVNEIRRYRLETGEFVGRLSTPDLSIHSLLTDRGLVVETQDVVEGGRVFLVDRGLQAICLQVPLLQRPQRFWPALSQLTVASDGRVFVANTNDDAVSVWLGTTPCPSMSAP